MIYNLSLLINSIRHVEETRENSKTVPHHTRMTVRATIRLSTARVEVAIKAKTSRAVSKTVQLRIEAASAETVTSTSLKTTMIWMMLMNNPSAATMRALVRVAEALRKTERIVTEMTAIRTSMTLWMMKTMMNDQALK